MNGSVRDQVKAEIAAYFFREGLADGARLTEDLDADMLTRFDLALRLEERFGGTLDDAAIAAWVTVGDVVATLVPSGSGLPDPAPLTSKSGEVDLRETRDAAAA
jgi:acyl carrier protein